jgi:hypothetical protein
MELAPSQATSMKKLKREPKSLMIADTSCHVVDSITTILDNGTTLLLWWTLKIQLLLCLDECQKRVLDTTEHGSRDCDLIGVGRNGIMEDTSSGIRT